MAAVGLAAKDGTKYRLTPVAENHLVPGKPQYMGDMTGILGSTMMWEGLGRLDEAVRHGGCVLPEHAETPRASFWEIFARSSGSMAFGASMALDRLLEPWLQKRDKVRVLDIAAGSGIYGYTLAKHANVELTTLDWPNVIAESKQWAKRLEVDMKRVRYLEGSLFEVDYRGPYDLILLSHVYHHFDPPTCQKLTRKVVDALASGGRLVVHEFFGDSANPAGILFSLTMLVWSRKGEAYSAGQYGKWMTEAGLTNVSPHPNQGMPTSFLFADKA
jgi:C-methyltransferase